MGSSAGRRRGGEGQHEQQRIWVLVQDAAGMYVCMYVCVCVCVVVVVVAVGGGVINIHLYIGA